ncbi:hypothetical protein SAMN04488009_2801 [Maribacter sedimenticola]|uniref:Uncharacterized protein n=1 Tax=Maribacter sedimenticola TaxID=228956 RepID=A0ABY1SJA0_9FLAO|nr:hypothetical protein [Maribacter sedimenticola]SNR60919.1 hypothetical protein SAMN04488009_2801 [Maribacter sedimenticola]
MKSTFTSDLNKERKLSVLLDVYYTKYLTQYNTKRIVDYKQQLAGIDVIFTHKKTKAVYYIDEKAQLDYVNDDLPTFAFELSYFKNNYHKEGWLFDTRKKTDFYALVTAIYEDEPSIYTTCKITLVNRKKLCSFLEARKITKTSLASYFKNSNVTQGKLIINELDHRTEGYLYFSTNTKVEKPINLILRLDFLIENGLAKRLV